LLLQNFFQFQTENQEPNGNVPVVEQWWVIALVSNVGGGHGEDSCGRCSCGHERHGVHGEDSWGGDSRGNDCQSANYNLNVRKNLTWLLVSKGD